MKRIGPLVIIIWLHVLALSVWMFLTPEPRGVRWGDLGDMELTTECASWDSAVVFRLYEGFDKKEWTVTAKLLQLPERQFLYTEESPVLDSLVCLNNRVTIFSGGKIFKEYDYSKAVEMWKDPDGFSDGEKIEGFWSEPWGVKRILGLFGILLALFMAVIVFLEMR